MSSVITIPKRLTKGDDLIIVSRKDYEDLKKHVYEMADALCKIRRGEKELKEGKTIISRHSLSEIQNK